MPEINPTDLTITEKAGLTSGADFWRTKPIDRVGLPSIMVTDGPHGLRKQAGDTDHLGIADSVPATCFPPAVGLGASFDPDLIGQVAAAIADEAAAADVAVVLGPGINIKRSPLCGRNFEYFSEDPFVAGVLGAAYVRGMQERGVGSSLKHFAANNQESDRMRVSADIDPRTLREIYLRGFERVVKDAQPWTIMSSYNRVNGVYASENRWLLTEVLREEWGFAGLVVSDWGGVNERVPGLVAGLDLEMPASGGHTDAQIVTAVENGVIDASILDQAAARVLALVRKSRERTAPPAPVDVEAHHALARIAAGRSVVLLKNDGDLLPLAASTRVGVIGSFAAEPRYQGAGSSLINPTRLDAALGAIREQAAQAECEVAYAPGFAVPGGAVAAAGRTAAELTAEALEVARGSQVVLLFLGLPAAAESEGFDREHIDLPAAQLELLEAVRAVNDRIVVVLANGGVVALPFAAQVPAIVEGWLLGQAGGGALADVLFGRVNPSARLAETIPLRLADNPAYGNFPGEFGHVLYGEGIHVGYRWYDAKGLDVAFPFGHGLSYTTFGYGRADATVAANGDVLVTVPVTNTGARAGREVVQAYVSRRASVVARAPRELKAFRSVAIEAGETVAVELVIRREDLAYWDIRVDRWVVEGGAYVIEVGASSRDLRTSTEVEIEGEPVSLPLTLNSSLADVLADPIAGPVARQAVTAMAGAGDAGDAGGAAEDNAMEKMMGSLPIGRVVSFLSGTVTTEQIEQLLAQANAGRG